MKKLLFVALALIGANFAGAQDTPRLFLDGSPVDSLGVRYLELFGQQDVSVSKSFGSWIIGVDAGQINGAVDVVRTGAKATHKSEFFTAEGTPYVFGSTVQALNYLTSAAGYTVADFSTGITPQGAKFKYYLLEKIGGND